LHQTEEEVDHYVLELQSHTEEVLILI